MALTRAEKRVLISYATTRYKNGNIVYPKPSRFIGEINPLYLDGYFVPARPSSEQPVFKTPVQSERYAKANQIPLRNVEIPAIDTSKLKIIPVDAVVPDMIIFHPNFGAGKVISLEGLGVNRKAKVYFSKHGQKVLLLKFAKLYVQED